MTPTSPSAPPGHLTPGQKKSLKMFAPAIGLGLLGTFFASFFDTAHLLQACLAGLWFGLTLGVGAQCVVTAQHGLKLRWALVPRRPLEWIGLSPAHLWLHVFLLCLLAATIYPRWWPGTDPETPRWFASTAFWIRSFVYLGLLTHVGVVYSKRSAALDQTGDPALATWLRKRSLADLLLVIVAFTGLTLEWILALHAREVSFWIVPLAGAWVLAMGIAGALALALIAMVFYERAGIGAERWNEESRGRLVRALAVWLVIGALAAAALVFVTRATAPAMAAAWQGHWLAGSWRLVSYVFVGAQAVALLLVLGPAKQRSGARLFAAALVLLAVYLQAFQLVMPALQPAGASFAIFYEIVGICVGISGAWIAFWVKIMEQPLYPQKDPQP